MGEYICNTEDKCGMCEAYRTAEPIVRCRDCWSCDTDKWWCALSDRQVYPEGFCAWAEKFTEESHYCANCEHGELHGFSKYAEEHGYPVTIYFWCSMKKRHDSAYIACELYEEGNNKRVYDDADGGF